MASKRVIIVHPDPYACGRLASRLYRTGLFAVDSAQDGFEAAVKLYTNAYDCFILHTQTPGLNPVRVVNQVRTAGDMARMPIVILCAETDPSTLQTLRSMGETYLLVEPFDPNELAQTTVRLTRARGGGTPAPAAGEKPASPPRERTEPVPREVPVALPPDALEVIEALPVETVPPEIPGDGVEFDPVHADVDVFTVGPAASPVDAELPPRRPTPGEPGREPSTAVGMGLNDVIWYRAERGAQIPGLPPGVSRLDDLVSGRLGDVLSKDLLAIDQSLAVAILRQSNSAEFSGMEKVAGLDQAMLRIGQRGVARHVITTWESRARIAQPTREFLLGDYWRHCLMVACIAEEIAVHLRYRNSDAVFTAGLLHDVGKLFFVTYFREDYARVEALAAATGTPFGGPLDISPHERELLKIDHGLIGQELCRAWLLPPVVQAGTLHHHLSSERARRIPDSLVTMIVALANLVEHTLRHVQEERYAAGYANDPTLSDISADMEMVAQEVLQGFYKSIYSTVPFWVHQFLRGKHVPLRLVYDSALRRVKRATRRAELQAYCPRWAGGTLEQRKTG